MRLDFPDPKRFKRRLLIAATLREVNLQVRRQHGRRAGLPPAAIDSSRFARLPESIPPDAGGPNAGPAPPGRAHFAVPLLAAAWGLLTELTR